MHREGLKGEFIYINKCMYLYSNNMCMHLVFDYYRTGHRHCPADVFSKVRPVFHYCYWRVAEVIFF